MRVKTVNKTFLRDGIHTNESMKTRQKTMKQKKLIRSMTTQKSYYNWWRTWNAHFTFSNLWFI